MGCFYCKKKKQHEDQNVRDPIERPRIQLKYLLDAKINTLLNELERSRLPPKQQEPAPKKKIKIVDVTDQYPGFFDKQNQVLQVSDTVQNNQQVIDITETLKITDVNQPEIQNVHLDPQLSLIQEEEDVQKMEVIQISSDKKIGLSLKYIKEEDDLKMEENQISSNQKIECQEEKKQFINSTHSKIYQDFLKIISARKQTIINEAIDNQVKKLVESACSNHLEKELKVSVISQSTFFFPIIQVENLNELNQDEFDFKIIHGITFINPKQQNIQIEVEDRFCSLHGSPIFLICEEEQCVSSLKNLICKYCMKDHKHHNYVELHEFINLAKKRQEQLFVIGFYIDLLFMWQAKKLKIASEAISDQCQFQEIKQQLQNVDQELHSYILDQNQSFKQILQNLEQGGLSKIKESVSQIYEKEGSYLQQKQVNFQFSDLVQKNQQLWDKLIELFGTQVDDQKASNINITIQGISVNVILNQISTFNDLDEQIKIEFIRKELFEYVFYDLMWLQEKQVVRLCRNMENIEESMFCNRETLDIIPLI